MRVLRAALQSPIVAILLAVAQGPGCPGAGGPRPLEVTYIGNEGFLIVMGRTKVLIDALTRSEHYASPSDSTVSRMMEGAPPFDGIDYLLVTHDHADHFDAELVSRFLERHPGVEFLADAATCGRLTGEGLADRRRSGIDLKPGGTRVFRSGNAEVAALCIPHGGSEQVANLAFIVRAGGATVVHMGDGMLAFSEGHLRRLDWGSPPVDLLFLQHFDRSAPTRDLIRDLIRPRRVVLMHIPPGKEESVARAEGPIHPAVVVFTRENETRRFEAP